MVKFEYVILELCSRTDIHIHEDTLLIAKLYTPTGSEVVTETELRLTRAAVGSFLCTDTV